MKNILLIATLIALFSTSATAWTKSEIDYINTMKDYCQYPAENLYGPNSPMTYNEKKKLGKETVVAFLRFHRAHPQESKMFNVCISDTWQTLKKYNLDHGM